MLLNRTKALRVFSTGHTKSLKEIYGEDLLSMVPKLKQSNDFAREDDKPQESEK
jgi:hypothetical protein